MLPHASAQALGELEAEIEEEFEEVEEDEERLRRVIGEHHPLAQRDRAPRLLCDRGQGAPPGAGTENPDTVHERVTG